MSAPFRKFPRLSLALALLLAACSKDTTKTTVPSAGAPRPNPPADETPGFAETLPQNRGPQGYAGSDACRSCHEDQYGSWHRSYHRSMTQIASEASVQANFDDVALISGNTRFNLQKRNGEFWVRMEPLVQAAAEGASPAGLEQRLGLVTGSHHMQVFWVPSGDGNLQLGFPFTWLIPEKRWVPRNSTFIRPPDLQHHSEVWNAVCSRCHTTGVQPHIDFTKRSAQTEVAELGISCEACHGPGEQHIQAQKAAAGLKKTLQPGEIIQPRKLAAERSAQVCGFCHSMKWMDKSTNWRENGFQFRPGDDLEQTTPVIRPSKVDSIPGLKDYLAKNPDILQDFFWPDGMIRVSGREFNGLIESPCFQGGKFSCVSCHSLHESDPDDQLAEKARGNGACLPCHDKYREAAALQAHTHHLPASSGSECYNCHMPHTTYGILSAIRSHQISSPKVADDLASGRPNACNLCHLDRNLPWAAEKLQAWYGQKTPQLPPENQSVSHVVNLALTGDAGQRALAAWHLSWPPAIETSSADWIEPILTQLLDDPYAAIRCVAARSLTADHFALPESYDYTIDPRTREPVRENLWKRWEQKRPMVKGAIREQVLLTGDGRIDRTRFDATLERRNNRTVRLRE